MRKNAEMQIHEFVYFLSHAKRDAHHLHVRIKAILIRHHGLGEDEFVDAFLFCHILEFDECGHVMPAASARAPTRPPVCWWYCFLYVPVGSQRQNRRSLIRVIIYGGV